MEDRKLERLLLIVQALGAGSTILGVSVLGILNFFSGYIKIAVVVTIVLVAFAVVGSILLWRLRHKYQSLLSQKDVNLSEMAAKIQEMNDDLLAKDAELKEQARKLEEQARKFEEQDKRLEKMIAEQERKDLELEEKDANIKRLNGEVEVWKQILITRAPIQAGYYMANKDKYDQFKTNLLITHCKLDVSLVRDDRDKEVFHLHFKWILEVLNPTSKSAKKARFIYSGDKNDMSSPMVTDGKRRLQVSMTRNRNVTGDDRFMEIQFAKPLGQNQPMSITIEYTLPKYKFNQKYDYIWLVPDALGFSEMNGFRIRFFSDGEAIKNTTNAVLRSYRLSEDYPIETDDPLIFKSFEDGGEGFECERGEENDASLKGHGFLLILKNNSLINDRNSLPDFLQNIPS